MRSEVEHTTNSSSSSRTVNRSLPSNAAAAPKDRPGYSVKTVITCVDNRRTISRQEVSEAWRAQMFAVLDGLEPRDPLLVPLWTAIFNAMTENSHARTQETPEQQEHSHEVTADIDSSCSSLSLTSKETIEGTPIREATAWKYPSGHGIDNSAEGSCSPSEEAPACCSRRSSASTSASATKCVSFDNDVTFFE
ncbi:hypothetical protein Pmar_PMAR023030 [Perkinsus marinus ATCC 50983]|uniref:Uncharacterized protein n=1 Tax=Perkinsus marinus (strain ATCC 50983 / TXsc) TaxID=423536 RepID=C5LHX7_PERM5|nr:hypothetical protein Pmar_PMAR023030 [Perkinsus marinus ATCC 50983]EER03731.1 hypothetical protein Pmar_PMAR023030 [Perkinsus marinus ATCC 50983]|eukprot:XP_002771915.1 hypothetical protein Pmar_PMAR023030 [Perkinsus marinus ATCC 50983]